MLFSYTYNKKFATLSLSYIFYSQNINRRSLSLKRLLFCYNCVMRFRNIKNNSRTNEKKEPQKLIYAPYSYRVKAFITDMFMIYAPILYIIAYVALSGKEDFQSSQIAPLAAITLYGVIYAFLLSKFAQTPGKKAYDIKVVDAKTGENLTFFRSLFRFVAFLFTATTLLGLFLPFYRRDKKALHDLICGTLVVALKK